MQYSFTVVHAGKYKIDVNNKKRAAREVSKAWCELPPEHSDVCKQTVWILWSAVTEQTVINHIFHLFIILKGTTDNQDPEIPQTSNSHQHNSTPYYIKIKWTLLISYGDINWKWELSSSMMARFREEWWAWVRALPLLFTLSLHTAPPTPDEKFPKLFCISALGQEVRFFPQFVHSFPKRPVRSTDNDNN